MKAAHLSMVFVKRAHGAQQVITVIVFVPIMLFIYKTQTAVLHARRIGEFFFQIVRAKFGFHVKIRLFWAIFLFFVDKYIFNFRRNLFNVGW